MTATAIDRLNAALAGRYEIERELGRGGMATVYLADDLRHERKVALKVLRPELAAVVGAERFLAEIKTTANLQHPHILPLFDSGEADGFLFYVMPHIEGETLAERIARERQLPVEEAVRIAVAVANALQVAHEKGVIHRDIKPANILLSGTEPLVADFGIALAVGAAGGDRITETGLSVGTPYYMSPEQATGDQTVGPASDVYALACVLYEMLVGEPPYLGNTAQAVLGKIIQGKPVSAREARGAVPANVDAAIRKALEKVAADRFREARDFGAALGSPGFRHGEAADAPGAGAPTSPWRRRVHGAITVALAGLAIWALVRPTPSTAPMRFEIEATPVPGAPLPYALAPDGSFLVFNAITDADAATASLHVRPMDALESRPVAGTDNGIMPTVSPTGAEVAFVVQSDRSLKVVPLQPGGVSRTIADSVVCCPSWGADGYVYYSHFDGDLRRVSERGGESEVVVPRSEGDAMLRPSALTRSGEAMVMAAQAASGGARIEIVRLSDGRREVLLEGVNAAQPTATGHLAYVDREGRLVAARLDERALRLESSPVELAGGLDGALPSFHISDSGDLVYFESASGGSRVQPVWVDRAGRAEAVDPAWSFEFSSLSGNRGFSLSPDGSRVATSVGSGPGGPSTIWIKQLPEGPFQPLVAGQGDATRPRWTPLGEAITYLATGEIRFSALRLRADFVTQSPDTIRLPGDLIPFELQLAPGEEWMAVRVIGRGSPNLMARRLDGTEEHIVETDFAERAIALSPDGAWLAYESDESGATQVFVRSFPDLGRSRTQVSVSGGRAPRWARTGRELFYLDDADNMVAVEVQAGDDLQIGEGTALFRVGPELVTADVGEFYTLYDVAPDDQRFLMMRSIERSGRPARTVVVLNAFELLEGRSGN